MEPAGKTTVAPSPLPIINCHAHIFTGDHVPDHLGKTVLPKPLDKWIRFRWVFARFRWYYERKAKKKYGGTANIKAQRSYENQMRIARNPLWNTLKNIVTLYATAQVLGIMLYWMYPNLQQPQNCWHRTIRCVQDFCYRWWIFIPVKQWWLQLPILLISVGFFKSARNLAWFLLKQSYSFLKRLPGKETKQLLERYVNIGRYAFHREQKSTLSDLRGQYPPGTGFVILPMDMEYMDAGPVAIPYRQQMEELAELKIHHNEMYPFVFADPRRMAAEPDYFCYTVTDTGEVVLQDCFIKTYIETHQFSGFKIYPALGYYPFDPLLLPLWKYAEQKNLPILTHCVRGPMYYRGSKKKAWDFHPVFEQTMTPDMEEGDGQEHEDNDNQPKQHVYAPLLLPQKRNTDFSANFTHPMNFLCLLKKEFLTKAVSEAWQVADADTRVKLSKIFGFAGADHVPACLPRGLDNLKICFGHFGGGDEWNRYFEKDRYNYSAQLARHPNKGIDFVFHAGKKTIARGKPEQLWKYTDWYSIICSMMLQHKNVYADISYILHDDAAILPLLKETLQNPGLRNKVLYGTDFYVVRNHKSDKNMLADMLGGLNRADFDQIARENPRGFLNLPSTVTTNGV
jgi:predicted TIM-barrel fold metal-dependent hydrolase